MLLMCDNASVHKADELKKLMEKYGIIVMFLPPNMTQWLQPLDRVVCGLIKTGQRARRGRHLAAALKQWKDEQECIVGEALLNKRPHPTLAPWLPPKPTLLQGIFFYQKTHMEELQLEKTKNAIRQVFIDTGITPFQNGRWKEYRRERFTNHTNSAASQVLSSVLKLQDRKCISAYLFRLGLDDQDPAQWEDAELSHLVVPEADSASDSDEDAEDESRGGGGAAAAAPAASASVVTSQSMEQDDDEEDDDDDEEEEEEDKEDEQQQQQQQHQSSYPIEDTVSTGQQRLRKRARR